MTKKEQAAIDAQIRELKIQIALRWTAPVTEDIIPRMPGEAGDPLVVGWLANLLKTKLFTGR